MSEALLEHVRTSPPRCIAGLVLSLLPEQAKTAEHAVTFLLAMTKGNDVARVRGYSLNRLDSSCKGRPLFLSPISLDWISNGSISEIFNSKVHGYHAEIGSTSGNICGSDEPDIWKCPGCAKDAFRVRIAFDYYGGADDLWEDEPDLKIENYFNGVRIYGTCASCSKISQPVGMDL